MINTTDKSSILDLSLEEWVTMQEQLLEMERTAEVEQAVSLLSGSTDTELQAQGISLFRLTVLDTSTGLFGRNVLTCGDHLKRTLPSHKFSSGDIVGIKVMGAGRSVAIPRLGQGIPVRNAYDYSGVVTATDDYTVTIALDEDSTNTNSNSALTNTVNDTPELGDRVRIDRLVDDVSYRRLKDVLQELKNFRFGPSTQLFSILFYNHFSSSATTSSNTTPKDSQSGSQRTFTNHLNYLPRFCELTAIYPSSLNSATSSSASFAATLTRADDPSSSTFSSSSSLLTTYGFVPFRNDLNASQYTAISAALRAQDICMIHGPPGTGKTTTMVEYIRQEVARGKRVLCCAPSNVAVDNLLERLAKRLPGSAPRLVRLGHPARVSKNSLAHSLEARVSTAEGTSIVQDVRKELTEVAKAKRTADKSKRRELRGEERRLRAEIRKREEAVVSRIIREADVVLATNTGAATRVLRRTLGLEKGSGNKDGNGSSGNDHNSIDTGVSDLKAFDVVVIDEVAQALELSCYIPALLGKKLIIAGDHCQLPPTIISDEAASSGLQCTLADRFVHKFDPDAAVAVEKFRTTSKGTVKQDETVTQSGSTVTVSSSAPSSISTKSIYTFLPLPVVHMLTIQYRMHETICQWASNALYHGKLVADETVRYHRLTDLPHIHYPSNNEDVCITQNQLSKLRGNAAESAKESIDSSKDESTTKTASSSSTAKAATTTNTTSSMMDSKTAEAVISHAGSVSSFSAGKVTSAMDVYVDQEALRCPMLLIDTAGCEITELKSDSNESKSNVGEADIVIKHVCALLSIGVSEHEIAVITPYNAQVSLLRALLGATYPNISVRSVDGYQGQEKEAVIISLVRSNESHTVGFLADYRRINVAVTRARRHVAIVTDSDTVASDPFIKDLVEYANEYAEVRTAMDYEERTPIHTVNTFDTSKVPNASGTNTESGKGSGKTNTNATAPSPKKKTTKGKHGRNDNDNDDPSKSAAARTQYQETRTLAKALQKQLKGFIRKCDTAFGVENVRGGTTNDAEEENVTKTVPSSDQLVRMANAEDNHMSTNKEEIQARLRILTLSRDTPPFSGAAIRIEDATQESAVSLLRSKTLPFSVSLVYPLALSGFHRALVHKVAEELGLEHTTQDTDIRHDQPNTNESSSSSSTVPPVRQITVRYRLPSVRYAAKLDHHRSTTTASNTSRTQNEASNSAENNEKAETVPNYTSNVSTPPPPPEHETHMWMSMLNDLNLDDDDDDNEEDENTVDEPQASSPVTVDEVATTVNVTVPTGKKGKKNAKSNHSQPKVLPPTMPSVSPSTGHRLGSKEENLSTTNQSKPSPTSALLASLHTERKERTTPDASSSSSSSSSSSTPGFVNTGTGADGIRREFGVPVVPLKPIAAVTLLSSKGNSTSTTTGSKGNTIGISSGSITSIEPIPAASSTTTTTTTTTTNNPSTGKHNDKQGTPNDNKGKSNNKKKNSGNTGNGNDEHDDDDEDMLLLDSLIHQSKSCAASNCKQSTQTTGTTCKFCHLRFCYSHGLPEVHGCGNAARTHARNEWKDQGTKQLLHGNGSSSTPEWKRNALSRELQKKIDAAATDRTPKNKTEKKK